VATVSVVDLDGLDGAALIALAGAAVRRAAAQPLSGAVDDGELTDSVTALHRLATMVQAEKLRRIAEVEARGAYLGQARSTADLLAQRCQLTRGEALRETSMADHLALLPRTAEGLADGSIGVAQARAATRTLEQLRDAADAGALDADTLADATARVDGHVADHGAGCDAGRLRRDLDELAAHSNRDHLAARERLAHARRGLWVGRATGGDDGMVRIDGLLDAVTGAKVIAGLAPLARRTGADDDRNVRQRTHDALGLLCDAALDAGGLPEVAVARPHVLLVTSPDALHDVAGAAPSVLDGYGPVSSATARQICCDADTTTVRTGRNSTILDVGRTRRDPSARQRRGVIARDRGCVGCGAPAARCQVHHIRWWRNGGHTDLHNLVLLCHACHAAVHHFGWTVTRHHDGRYKATGPPVRDPIMETLPSNS